MCDLHDLQRCAVLSSGLEGKPCRNPGGKKLLRRHHRLVALTRRNRYVAEGIRKRQTAAGIPAHKTLNTTKTHKIRWGNQAKQIDQNCTMQPLIDPTLSGLVASQQTSKKADEPVLVDSSGDEYIAGDETDAGGHQVQVQVPKGAVLRRAFKAQEMAFSMSQWIASTHFAAYLDHLYVVKETIEKQSTSCGMNLFLMSDLASAAAKEVDLVVKALPECDKLASRQRARSVIEAAEIDDVVKVARVVLCKEIEERFFNEIPGKTRLQSAVLCKQAPWKSYLPAEWHGAASAAYLEGLRSASRSIGLAYGGNRVSPRKKASQAPTPLLFRGSSASPAVPTAPSATRDPVLLEQAEFAAMPESRWFKFLNPMGMLDEFRFFASLKKTLPLHHRLFQMTAAHLGHEANVESEFSIVKALDDPNMDVDFLIKMVKANGRKKTSKPVPARVWLEYEVRYRDKDNTIHDGDGDDDELIEGEEGDQE